MSKIKELLDEINQQRPDWILDAEYMEWAEWSSRPHITNKDKES